MENQAFNLESESPKISELVEKAKLAENESVNLMEPGSKIKRGRGRPPKAQADSTQKPEQKPLTSQPRADQIPTRKIVEPFARLMSKAAGAYVGDKRAEMSVQELDDLSQALAMVADKWMPVLSKDYGPEMLLATTITSYGIRVVTLKKILDEERKAVQAFKPEPGKKPSDTLAFPQEPKTMASEPYLAQNLSL